MILALQLFWRGFEFSKSWWYFFWLKDKNCKFIFRQREGGKDAWMTACRPGIISEALQWYQWECEKFSWPRHAKCTHPIVDLSNPTPRRLFGQLVTIDQHFTIADKPLLRPKSTASDWPNGRCWRPQTSSGRWTLLMVLSYPAQIPFVVSAWILNISSLVEPQGTSGNYVVLVQPGRVK